LALLSQFLALVLAYKLAAQHRLVGQQPRSTSVQSDYENTRSGYERVFLLAVPNITEQIAVTLANLPVINLSCLATDSR
jgi:hypothetical protein